MKHISNLLPDCFILNVLTIKKLNVLTAGLRLLQIIMVTYLDCMQWLPQLIKKHLVLMKIEMVHLKYNGNFRWSQINSTKNGLKAKTQRATLHPTSTNWRHPERRLYKKKIALVILNLLIQINLSYNSSEWLHSCSIWIGEFPFYLLYRLMSYAAAYPTVFKF